MRAYEDTLHNDELRHRAYMMIRGDAFPLLRDAGVYTGLGNEWVRVGGVKFAPTGRSERTMRMSTPYVGTERLRHPHDDAGRDPRARSRTRTATAGRSASTPTAT